MRSLRIHYFALSFLLLPLLVLSAYAGTISLGTAGSYAVLAGSTVTNTGPSVITGNLGVWDGTAVTGFPPGIVTKGTIHAGDTDAENAQSDLTTAYNAAAGMSPTSTLTGKDLGGMTLTPGIYFFKTSAGLTGELTLDDLGNSNALFGFQIGSTLTTASSSSVVFKSGETDNDVYWQVGSSATLGTGTTFQGNILALTSITLDTGASIVCGSALARNGAVTLDDNTITSCGSSETTVPEPGTLGLMGSGLAILAGIARRRMRI